MKQQFVILSSFLMAILVVVGTGVLFSGMAPWNWLNPAKAWSCVLIIIATIVFAVAYDELDR